jgi:phenylalanine-4-hydroxylase
VTAPTRSTRAADARSLLPPSLATHVVAQPPAYSAAARAVWRFSLQQLQKQLLPVAHPAYAAGLRATGIGPSAVPRISQISTALAGAGWHAVCVDGFVPPRVFQEFQARGILPIAGAVRPPAQLAYTPAPDIIHEAAGHAPLLIVPEYAAYLRAIGEVARKAFAHPADGEVDRAVRALSDLKLQADANAEQLKSAEENLERALAQAGAASEARRITRLYWWTAEYGLVGSVDDYRLYGAGLLSSLGESLSCHSASVEKLPLSLACTERAFDITRPQPLLFVAPDFTALHRVLEETAASFAFRAGGRQALRVAAASRELCTITLERGIRISGVLDTRCPVSGGWLCFEPGARLLLPQRSPIHYAGQLVVPLGLTPQSSGKEAGRVNWRLPSGLEVRGQHVESARTEVPEFHVLSEVRITWGGHVLVESAEPYPLILAGDVLTAEASSDNWDEATAFSSTLSTRAPTPELVTPAPLSAPAPARGHRVYERVRTLHPGAALRAAALYAQARAEASDDWLLLWNLLEKLSGHKPRKAAVSVKRPAPHAKPRVDLRRLLIAQIRRDLELLQTRLDGMPKIPLGGRPSGSSRRSGVKSSCA